MRLGSGNLFSFVLTVMSGFFSLPYWKEFLRLDLGIRVVVILLIHFRWTFSSDLFKGMWQYWKSIFFTTKLLLAILRKDSYSLRLFVDLHRLESANENGREMYWMVSLRMQFVCCMSALQLNSRWREDGAVLKTSKLSNYWLMNYVISVGFCWGKALIVESFNTFVILHRWS